MSLFQFGFTRNKANNDHKFHRDPKAEVTSKRRSETDESSVTDNYEKTIRLRRYQPSWEKDFPWLCLDKDQNKMCCQLCRAFPALTDVNSSLFAGTSGFRRTTIQAHARSKSHHRCFEAKCARENPAAAPIGRVLRNMSAEVQEKLGMLFNTAYFVGKENLAFSKFPELCKLQMKNGLDLGETYLNDYGCRLYPSHFICYEE